MNVCHQPELIIIKSLQNADRILCVSHVAPDGDAIGSLTGMGILLEQQDKRVTLALQDEVPREFRNLPRAERIIGPDSVVDDYDLIVCLDASSPDRMGKVYRKPQHSRIPLTVIDHHITNTLFGTENWVAPECAATCQMLVYLADALHLPLEEDLARCLLTGLVTDTLCFRTANSTADVLAVATRLVAAGANLAEITAQTLNNRPFSVLKLWSLVLPNMQLEDGVIWVTVPKEYLDEVGNSAANAQLSSTLITVAEADISAVFTERISDDGRPRVECSFRAKPGYNVGELALRFGGGGHPPASGCTIDGTLSEVTTKVVAALKQARKAQQLSPDPV